MTTQTNQTQRFEVTKDLLEGYVSKGYTIEMMANKITELANTGRKCSAGAVRKLCKFYNINLRKKSTSFFVPATESANQEVKAEVKTPEEFIAGQ